MVISVLSLQTRGHILFLIFMCMGFGRCTYMMATNLWSAVASDRDLVLGAGEAPVIPAGSLELKASSKDQATSQGPLPHNQAASLTSPAVSLPPTLNLLPSPPTDFLKERTSSS